MTELKIQTVDIKKPGEINFILGQSHFIKTVEDVFEAMVNSTASAKFGVAFCEASMHCKIRVEGNDEELMKMARENAENIGAGHSFIVFMKDCFPLNVLNNIQNIPEVCRIFCATANPTKVLVVEDKNADGIGRGIIGVIDGFKPKGVENQEEKDWRKKFLRDINYKL